MFAVFHKHPGGRLEWIGGAETEERARLMARMWSRYGNTEVVVVENGPNGRTQHRATFLQGQVQTPRGHSAGAGLNGLPQLLGPRTETLKTPYSMGIHNVHNIHYATN